MNELKKYKEYILQIAILVVLVLIIFLIFVLGFRLVKGIIYRSSDSYKLEAIGYSSEESSNILKLATKEQLDSILSHSYDKNIDDLLSSKYLIFNKLDQYLEYMKAYSDIEVDDAVAMVNCNRDRAYYYDAKETDTSLNEEMLVNKYYLLPESYSCSNLVKISSTYAYGENYMDETAYKAFIEMAKDLKAEGSTIIISDAYRTYEKQSTIWKNRAKSSGEDTADQYAARAGASDHETGYGINITDFNHSSSEFTSTASYTWLLENSYKYGFIQRYPFEKDDLTGFSYEPGHFRYVGVEAAKIIYNEGLTFDEYYAFYIENK